MKKIYLLTVIFVFTCSLSIFANCVEIDGIYYILDEENRTATVTYTGTSSGSMSNYPSSVVIPDSVEYLTISYDVTRIGDYAFFNSLSTTFVSLPTNLLCIDEYAFSYTRIKSITIPDKTRAIKGNAFMGCDSLSTLVIGRGVDTIEVNAFTYCRSLSDISVASGNATYDSRNNCNAIILTTNNEIVVGGKKTVIPDGVIRIGAHSFNGQKDLTSFTLTDAVISIGTCAFANSGLTSIYIPKNVNQIENAVFLATPALESIIVSPDNSVFDSRNDCNAIIESETNTLIEGCRKTIIPKDVRFLGEFAFWGCSSLDTLYCLPSVPPTVISINFANTFVSISSNAVLCVPYSSIDAYKSVNAYNKHFAEIKGFSDVTDTTATSATITWLPDPDVVEYTIRIYTSDTLYRQYIVDGNGQIVSSQQFAPAIHKIRMDTTMTSTEYFVISLNELSSGISYTYMIDGIDINHTPVYHEEGLFTTRDIEWGVEQVCLEPKANSQKLIKDGQLLIEKNGMLFNVTGTLMKYPVTNNR